MHRFLPIVATSFLVACVVAAAAPAVAHDPHPWCDSIADAPPLKGAPSLAPGGTLRIGINLGNPNNASLDPATGRVRGVAVDLACALAARLNVPLAFVTYAAIPPRLAGLDARAFDVGFSFDPALAPKDMRTGIPHIFIPNAYVVAGASRFQRSADLDNAGVTIAVARGNSPDVFLSGKLRAAPARGDGQRGTGSARRRRGRCLCRKPRGRDRVRLEVISGGPSTRRRLHGRPTRNVCASRCGSSNADSYGVHRLGAPQRCATSGGGTSAPRRSALRSAVRQPPGSFRNPRRDRRVRSAP